MEDHKGLGGAMTLTKNDLVANVNELGFTKKKSVDIIDFSFELAIVQIRHGASFRAF